MADKTSLLYFVLVVSSVLLQVSQCSLYSSRTVYQRIYEEVGDIKACFRLLDATRQIGCSATPSNVSGVLWYIESQDNITYLLDNHQHAPYIVIMEPHLFKPDNVHRLMDSSHVNGVIMYYNMSGTIPPELSLFSPAETCPNSGFGYGDCRNWNTNGSGLTYQDFNNFAIFTITSEESYQRLKNCFLDHNQGAMGGYGDYPLCSAELQADMQAVRSTPECYKRANIWTNLGVPACQPLGDESVWGTLFELRDNSDIIIVATKLDSNALIPDLAYGANNEAVGIVTQLAVAEALGRLKRSGELTGFNKEIVFMFFHGESFDYIGSSRVVYDMLRNKFPYSRDSGKQQPPLLNLTNISSILELSQVGIQSDPSTDTPLYYLHSNDKTSTLYTSLTQDNSSSASFMGSSVEGGTLPPSSVKMFLREKQDIPSVVVTDYDKNFKNMFFGSRYDTLSNLLGNDVTLTSSSPVVVQLTQLASSLAGVLLDVSGATYSDPSSPPIPSADPDTVAGLLECLLVQTNCSLLRTVLNPTWVDTLDDSPASRYVTVSTVSNRETQFVYNLLAYFTGTLNTSFTTCNACDDAGSSSNQVYTYTTMSGLSYDSSVNNCTCYKSYTHRHDATSPAFDMKDYTSKTYSTWTESNWNGIGMRIYLVTYPLLEGAIFIVGLTISLISFFVAWQCNRKSRNIFAITANRRLEQTS